MCNKSGIYNTIILMLRFFVQISVYFGDFHCIVKVCVFKQGITVCLQNELNVFNFRAGETYFGERNSKYLFSGREI